MKKYEEVSSAYDPVKTEKEILNFWEKNNVFEKSVNKGTEEFIFFDGPPFANGMPHYGHLLTGFVKDTIARYQTMCGKKVERRFGWDCHGLPAEMSVEKELGISGRVDIQNYGIEKFNAHCKKSAMKYVNEWHSYVERQCRWVDFENSYKTMDTDFMESVFWAFKQLYDKGLVYESIRVMPYSWKCQTPLSNFETKMDNAYREKTSKSVTVFFELNELPKSLDGVVKSCRLLAWTTTPWTLPSNLALAIKNGIQYSCFISDNVGYICSKTYSNKFISDKKIQYSDVLEIDPAELIGLGYKPLFPFFNKTKNAFIVLDAGFVQETEGTGIVHMAPGFGEDDFQLCTEHKIEVICPIDDGGNFTDAVPDFSGIHVFDTNDQIIMQLKKDGMWYETSQYIHKYPHCWRTDTPLIFRAMPSWYIAVTKFKDRMVELNETVNWVPENVKHGQFGSWLKGARDWSISRNRFWGTPIPIWKSTNTEYPRIDVYGSIAEIEKDFGVKVDDLHLPFIDSLTRPNPDDPTGQSIMQRVDGVFDCWFESGSMPFAQSHYPFKENLRLPADFVSEYIAQTRGWFYTMFVMSTALFDNIPFKNCMCHGVVLDIHGQKLSKRLNNYQDPMEVFDKYGSDALRFLMLSSNVISGGTLLLDQDAVMVMDVLKTVINQIWNGYYFFTMYANIDEINCTLISKSENVMDTYILTKCNTAVQQIKTSMDSYNPSAACHEVESFFDALNNWYIRSNKQRFWKNTIDDDKMSAYNTLYTVFNKMCRAFAPVLPAIAEKIWIGMKYNGLSVHLADFPQHENLGTYRTETMDLVRDVCTVVLSLRNTHKLRVRQPLQSITIYHPAAELISDYYSKILSNEVNVKEVRLVTDTTTVATKKIKLNFNLISQRMASSIPTIMNIVKAGNWKVLKNGQLAIGNEISLLHDEFEIILETNSTSFAPFDNNKGVIEINTAITRDLLLEGHARDIIRHIQQTRKSLELEVFTKISVIIDMTDIEMIESFNVWKQHIMEQVLAETCEIIKPNQDLSSYSVVPCNKKGLVLYIR